MLTSRATPRREVHAEPQEQRPRSSGPAGGLLMMQRGGCHAPAMTNAPVRSQAEANTELHAERRDKILTAAGAAIVLRGYDAVRLRDVAAECGVTTGMIQHYFDSREQLLTAAFERAALDQVAAWDVVTEAEHDAGRQLHVLIDRIADELASRDACVIWTELCACASRNPHLQSLVQHVFERWHQLIRDAIIAGMAAGTLQSTLTADDAASLLLAA